MDLFSGSEGSSSRSSSVEADDVDAGSGADFNINKEYAARFEHNKQRTELQQLEEKHGKNVDSTDESSSEDETEDEEGEQITADVDAAILTTLAKIRRKDESIYEAGKRVFDGVYMMLARAV
jgi:protein KRI1